MNDDLSLAVSIAREAGGRFTDRTGRPTHDGGSGVSTNGLVHDDVLAVLRGPP